MILITGATGQLGGLVLENLIKKGSSPNSIALLVRDEEKAVQLREKGFVAKIGSYDDYSSLVSAFKGIDKLLFISGSDVQLRSQQHENVVKAAQEAEVGHVFYTSFERRNETETSPISFVAKAHLETEKALQESGIKHTIFRNNLYMDLLPAFIGEKVSETGIYFPAGEEETGFVLRSDLAEAIAQSLISEGHENKTYYLTNPEKVKFGAVSEFLSGQLKANITYFSPSSVDYVNTLTGAGVPAEFAQFFAAFGAAIQEGEFNTEKTDLENLLGRKPIGFREYLSSVY